MRIYRMLLVMFCFSTLVVLSQSAICDDGPAAALKSDYENLVPKAARGWTRVHHYGGANGAGHRVEGPDISLPPR